MTVNWQSKFVLLVRRAALAVWAAHFGKRRMGVMKYRLLAAGLLIGICGVATAVSPPMPPANYANGPAAPLFSDAGIFVSERTAYALLEGVLQQTEVAIAASSCTNSAGTFDIFLYADGSLHNPDFNFVTVDSPASTFTLNADVNYNNTFRGQTLTIRQSGMGALKRIPLISYQANASYNAQSSIMTMKGISTVIGINGVPDAYQEQIIKDFYVATDDTTGLPYIFDWGLQSLSKLNYPVQKYWQRSKSLRDDGVIGRTVFVKERLVGPNACRIVIDMSGYNNADYFWQSGTLTVSTEPPNPQYQFNF